MKMTSNDHFAQRSTASGPASPICFASLIALCAALVFLLRAPQLLLLAGAAGFSPDQVYLMWFSLICVVVGEMYIDFVSVAAAPVNTGPPPSRAVVVRVPVFTPVFSPNPKPKPTTSQFKDLFKSMCLVHLHFGIVADLHIFRKRALLV